MKASKGSRGIALLFLNLSAKWRWVVNATPQPALPLGKTQYVLYRRLGRPPGTVWMGAENLAPTGIRSPDRPASSESLYRLRYPNPPILNCMYIYFILQSVYWTFCCLHADQILLMLPALQQACATWSKSLPYLYKKIKNLHVRVVCRCSIVTSRSIWVRFKQKRTQRIANFAGLVRLPPQPKDLGAT
jgi:hypothetical protein